MILANAKRDSNVSTLVDVDSMEIPIDPFDFGYDQATSLDTEKKDEDQKKLPAYHASPKDDNPSMCSGALSPNPPDVSPTLTEGGDEKKHGHEKKGKEKRRKKDLEDGAIYSHIHTSTSGGPSASSPHPLPHSSDEHNDSMTEDAPLGGAYGDQHVESSEVLFPTFTGSFPNVTPVRRNPAARSAPAPELFEHESALPSHKDLRPDGDPIPIALVGNPIKALGSRSFTSNGALPEGFPEVRDVTKDVVAGKIPVRGQSCFSRVDIINTDPQVYHDALPLPPRDLFAALVPVSQNLIYGDGLPYAGFLRSFSITDLPNFEWTKLIGLVTFLILPNFAPFQDEAPFFSHRTVIENLVAMLRTAKKQYKPTMVWVAYESRSNVADVELATILDRRIDLVPALNFLWLSVVCPIIHLAHREGLSENIQVSTNPLDHPLILFNSHRSHYPRAMSQKPWVIFPRMYRPTNPFLLPYIPPPQRSSMYE